MKIGEIMPLDREITLNEGRKTVCIDVANTGDRPIQVGSHFHFFEVNKLLSFNREKAYGMRLDIPSGTSVRFEPGEQKSVQLVEIVGNRAVYGLNDLTSGNIDEKRDTAISMAKEKGFRIMQFNAVVASNTHALHLYERIGFTKLGIIPGGFRMPDGHYEDIIPHYYVL